MVIAGKTPVTRRPMPTQTMDAQVHGDKAQQHPTVQRHMVAMQMAGTEKLHSRHTNSSQRDM